MNLSKQNMTADTTASSSASESPSPTDIRNIVNRLIDLSKQTGKRLRYTTDADGVPDMFSAIDTISLMCECDNKEASNKFQEMQVSGSIGNLKNKEMHRFSGAGQRDTPVVCPSDLINIIGALPLRLK